MQHDGLNLNLSRHFFRKLILFPKLFLCDSNSMKHLRIDILNFIDRKKLERMCTNEMFF